VRLTAKNNDYVQARPGYFAPTNAPPAAPPEPREIDRLAMTADVLTAVPIQLAGRMGKGEPNDPSLSLVIRVDLNPLKFSEGGDRHMQKLMFLAELLDGGGRMVTAKEGVMDLALKDDTLTRLKASGINATLGLNAPPGPYKVRVVVQDADGKIGAVNQAVEIPK